jgi:putative component of toxin-antitoxin plasmid stabilization module
MLTIYTTPLFDGWFGALKDKQSARRIQVRIDRAEDGHLGTTSQLVKAFGKCGCTMGLDFGCISRGAAMK